MEGQRRDREKERGIDFDKFTKALLCRDHLSCPQWPKQNSKNNNGFDTLAIT